jgi:hypothetical protein
MRPTIFIFLAALTFSSGFGWAGAPPPPALPESGPTVSQVAYLKGTAQTLLAGCQVAARDGTLFYTPDGKGNYKALWTRDFAYMVENAGDLMPAKKVEACLEALIHGIRADGATPDRVRPDGVAVYAAGPEDHPLGLPNLDNASFLVVAVDEHLKGLPPEERPVLFEKWVEPLDRAMNYIPRDASGLVYNDPARPHSPYGFTDTVAKTGLLFMESLLYWDACQRMAAWHHRTGHPARAKDYQNRARLIEANLDVLWNDQAGAFFAATRDCRQTDVWGNAYAVYLGFPLGAKRERILKFLVTQSPRYLWHGQVRHLLEGEHWQRMLAPIEPGRYQNGAYWATASGWVIWALAQTDPALARRTWNELIDDFQNNGVCECVNGGYRQLESYVVSAANPLGAVRRLGW